MLYKDAIGYGRMNMQPTVLQKQMMAKLLNKIGFYSTKWHRLLSIDVTETISIAMHVDDGDSHMDTRLQIAEIMRKIHTRKSPRNNLKICAVLVITGGCMKAFPTINELASHIYDRFGDSWNTSVKLKNE